MILLLQEVNYKNFLFICKFELINKVYIFFFILKIIHFKGEDGYLYIWEGKYIK